MGARSVVRGQNRPTYTARPLRENCTRPFLQGKDTEVRAPPGSPSPFHNRGYAQDPAPTPQQPDARTSPLVKNYDENARCADGYARGILHSSRRVSMDFIGPLGSSSFSLPTIERGLAKMEGSSTSARECRHHLSSGVRRDLRSTRCCGTISISFHQ